MKYDTRNHTPLTEGGEGYIYEEMDNIIKVFKPHIDLKSKEKKIDALMKEPLHKCVIKPTEKVFDSKGKFIGYVMEKANGEEFKRLSNKKFCKVSRIDTKFLLEIIIKAKQAIEDLHKRNIFIGDLNDQNILFDKQGNISFLDCDSWAVGGEKCTVAMDLFKDKNLVADNFNADTDNYAFMVLAWKILTRIHPFGGTMQPDIPITDRINKGISVIGRSEVKVPKTVRKWSGLSPDLLSDFKSVFEGDNRVVSAGFEDMLTNLSHCKKCNEYYYSKFSSCPYCDSSAEVNKKPQTQGTVGGLKIIPLYNPNDISVVIDRYTYIDKSGDLVNGNDRVQIIQNAKYHFIDDKKMVMEYDTCFYAISDKSYQIRKKYKAPIEVCSNKVFYISESNTFTEMTVLDKGNAVKNICKTSNNVYFSVDDEHYCIVNQYAGKLIVNVDGMNTEIDYKSDIQNYGIHRDKVSGKWLILLEDSKLVFNTFVINKNNVEYHTDQIKYECSLFNPCISNSTIFIPIDSKIRGFAYQKSAFKDFECGIVSEESKLIKEGKRFTVVNLENVYRLEG